MSKKFEAKLLSTNLEKEVPLHQQLGYLTITETEVLWTSSTHTREPVRILFSSVAKKNVSKDSPKIRLVLSDNSFYIFQIVQGSEKDEVVLALQNAGTSLNASKVANAPVEAVKSPAVIPRPVVPSKSMSKQHVASFIRRLNSIQSRQSVGDPLLYHYDLEKLKSELLSENPLVKQWHQDLVLSRLVPESSFWEYRLIKQLLLDISRRHSFRGRESAMYVVERAVTQEAGEAKLNMTQNLKDYIFRKEPAVREAFNTFVPSTLAEAEFWAKYFEARTASMRADVLAAAPVSSSVLTSTGPGFDPKSLANITWKEFFDKYKRGEFSGVFVSEKSRLMAAAIQFLPGHVPSLHPEGKSSDMSSPGLAGQKRGLSTDEPSYLQIPDEVNLTLSLDVDGRGGPSSVPTEATNPATQITGVGGILLPNAAQTRVSLGGRGTLSSLGPYLSRAVSEFEFFRNGVRGSVAGTTAGGTNASSGSKLLATDEKFFKDQLLEQRRTMNTIMEVNAHGARVLESSLVQPLEPKRVPLDLSRVEPEEAYKRRLLNSIEDGESFATSLADLIDFSAESDASSEAPHTEKSEGFSKDDDLAAGSVGRFLLKESQPHPLNADLKQLQAGLRAQGVHEDSASQNSGTGLAETETDGMVEWGSPTALSQQLASSSNILALKDAVTMEKPTQKCPEPRQLLRNVTSMSVLRSLTRDFLLADLTAKSYSSDFGGNSNGQSGSTVEKSSEKSSKEIQLHDMLVPVSLREFLNRAPPEVALFFRGCFRGSRQLMTHLWELRSKVISTRALMEDLRTQQGSDALSADSAGVSAKLVRLEAELSEYRERGAVLLRELNKSSKYLRELISKLMDVGAEGLVGVVSGLDKDSLTHWVSARVLDGTDPKGDLIKLINSLVSQVETTLIKMQSVFPLQS